LVKIKNIPCVILSGGKSSRMGEDKSLLPFGNFKTLIEFQYTKLSTIFENVYISSKNDKFTFPCKIVYDKNEIYSPMVALESIFYTLKEDSIFIISVDTPLVKEASIRFLIEQSLEQSFDAIICKDANKIHNLIGVFKRVVEDKIGKMLVQNNHKINTLLTKEIITKIVFFEDANQFTNINEKDDYLNLVKKFSTFNRIEL
jgi:molybdopterin-guanine dinucleotide biosynthesis protein A